MANIVQVSIYFSTLDYVNYIIPTELSFCLQEYNSIAEAGGFGRDAEVLLPGEGTHCGSGEVTVKLESLKAEEDDIATKTEMPSEVSKSEHDGGKLPMKQVRDKHIRIHEKNKPFKCDICDYSVTRKCELIKHSRIHTGEKPFKCHDCNYTAAEKSNLIRHLRIHTGERRKSCHSFGEESMKMVGTMLGRRLG